MKEKCEEVGGEWNEDSEFCIVEEDNDSIIAASIITMTGFLLSATIIWIPVGIGLIIYGTLIAMYPSRRKTFAFIALFTSLITLVLFMYLGIILFDEIVEMFESILSNIEGAFPQPE